MNNESIYQVLEQHKASLGKSYEVLLIMSRGGFRVSEVLKMHSNNIINETDIFITASKGSRSKRVHVPEISKSLIKYKSASFSPYATISRFQMYRTCKRIGLIIDNGVKRNKSVTHSLRKSYIKESFISSKDIGITADIVGHKSIKSTEHYVK